MNTMNDRAKALLEALKGLTEGAGPLTDLLHTWARFNHWEARDILDEMIAERGVVERLREDLARMRSSFNISSTEEERRLRAIVEHQSETETHPLAVHAYCASHGRGPGELGHAYTLVIGFDTLEQVQAAHEYVVRVAQRAQEKKESQPVKKDLGTLLRDAGYGKPRPSLPDDDQG